MYRKRRIPVVRPRVRIHKSGSITLTGIDYKDLKSIFTAASLYRYDHPVKSEYKDELEWERRIKYVIDMVEKGISDEIQKSFPWSHEKTIAKRMETVKEEKRFRLIMDEIINELTAKYVKQIKNLCDFEWKVMQAISMGYDDAE